VLEIATAVLCASFPELGPIFMRKRKRTGPTTSIVNGNYRFDGSDGNKKKGGGYGISSKISRSMRRLESDPYFELEEGGTYHAQATARNHHDDSFDTQQGEGRGDVTITREIRLESNSAV
jgi:hypothetical protein